MRYAAVLAPDRSRWVVIDRESTREVVDCWSPFPDQPPIRGRVVGPTRGWKRSGGALDRAARLNGLGSFEQQAGQ